MILSPVMPLETEEQTEVLRLEARVNTAIKKYHVDGAYPVVHVPFETNEPTRKSLQRAIRAEGWRIHTERGVDALIGGWETWTLHPTKKSLIS